MPDQLTDALLAREAGPQAAWQKAESIGAPGIGSHYLPTEGLKDIWDLLKEYVLGSHEMPRSVQAKDPFGTTAVMSGKWPAEALGGLMMGSTEPVKPLQGFYSRLDKAFEKAPNSMHSNRAKALGAAASKEEQQFRGFDDLLASKGDKPIGKEEIQSHLQQNPIDLKLTTWGRPDRWDVVTSRSGGLIESFETPEEASAYITRVRPDLPNLPLRVEEAVSYPTQYGQYKVPGGTKYEENLFHYTPEFIHEPISERGAGSGVLELNYGPESTPYFTGQPSGWVSKMDADYLDLLDPQDQNKRWLGQFLDKKQRFETIEEANQAVRGWMREHEPNLSNSFNTINNEYRAPHFGNSDRNLMAHSRTTNRNLYRPDSPELTKSKNALDALKGTIWNTADQRGLLQDIIQNREKELPKPSPGRFIEELQSDWHQAGRKQGYREPDHFEVKDQITDKLAKLNQEFSDASNRYNLTEWNDPRAAEIVKEQQRLSDELSNLIDQLTIHDSKVIDAPFKESWPDLLLKQQVLDVARDPKLEWLGTSTAQPHVDRYGSPRYAWMEDPTTPGQYEVAYQQQVGGNNLPFPEAPTDPEGLANYIRRHYTGRVTGLDDLLGHEAFGFNLDNDKDEPQKLWRRMSGSKTGIYEPRREGQQTFYDQTVPAKLEKLLKPFGGKVEPIEVASNRLPADHPSVKPSFSAWVAKLTPEMKQRILKDGLPLLMALYAVYNQTMGEDDGAGQEQ